MTKPSKKYKERERYVKQQPPKAANTKARKCLCCGEIFASTGVYNRLCTLCRKKNAGWADDC